MDDFTIKDLIDGDCSDDVIKRYIEIKGNQELCISAQNNNAELVKLLINKGVNIHAGTDCALRHACEHGNLELVQFLLDNGANINASEDAPLTRACCNGHIKVVELLLSKGVNVNRYKINSSDNALIQASKNNRLDIVELLLKNGADLHVLNDYALRYAALNNDLETCKLLIKHGANVTVNNNECLRYSGRNGYLKIVKLLIEHDAVVTDDVLKEASFSVRRYLENLNTKLYYGIESDTKLTIKLPDLLEIEKNNKWYYFYEGKYEDGKYCINNVTIKEQILQSLINDCKPGYYIW